MFSNCDTAIVGTDVHHCEEFVNCSTPTGSPKSYEISSAEKPPSGLGYLPCKVNDRDTEMSVFSLMSGHQSGIKNESSMIYAGDQEVQNIVDIIKNGNKIMVLMRGLPGSGKSTLAHHLMRLSVNTSTLTRKHVFSADDYFVDPESNFYQFNRDLLREAHSWNIKGVRNAAQKNVTPILVDNTNLTVSEMRPYVHIAAKYGYIVKCLEPITHWRYNVHECAKRNLHCVSEKHIAIMMGRFDRSVPESELFSLVSSQNNFQNICQQKHCSKKCRRRKLHSIGTHIDKVFERPCILPEDCFHNLTKVSFDVLTKTFLTLSVLRCPMTHNFLFLETDNKGNELGRKVSFSTENCSQEWSSLDPYRNKYLRISREQPVPSCLCNSVCIKILFSEGFLSMPTTQDPRKQHQICDYLFFRNNLLALHDHIVKWKSFLPLFVYILSGGTVAGQLTYMNERYANRLSVQKCSSLTSKGRYAYISSDKLRTILPVDNGVQPFVNIDKVYERFISGSVNTLFLTVPRNICGSREQLEADNGNKRNKISHIYPKERIVSVSASADNCNVNGWSINQSSLRDLEDARGNCESCDLYNNDSYDSWHTCNNCNSDSWGVCDNTNYSWDVCNSVSWETDSSLTQLITLREADCIPPKPPRTNRKTRIKPYFRKQSTHKIARGSTQLRTDVEAYNSLPKPQRTTRRPRIMQYSWEEYASKLERETMMLSPELETWNAVEDPLSSWEGKQNIGCGNALSARCSPTLQNMFRGSSIIKLVRTQEISSPSAGKKEQLCISKPQRVKRFRNHQ